MNVQAINNISSQQNFVGKAKKTQHNIDYPQTNVVITKEAAKAIRDVALGLMVLGATVGAGASLTSCTSKSPVAGNEELSEDWVVTSCGDTVYIDKAKALDNFINPKFK